MIDITIDTTAVDATIDRLTERTLIYAPMVESMALLHSDMATYPTQRPTTYRRTGHLGRRWTTKVSQDGSRGEIGNNTPYGPYVQDAQRQAQPHVGHWQTDEQVMRRREAEIRRIFDKTLQKAAK